MFMTSNQSMKYFRGTNELGRIVQKRFLLDINPQPPQRDGMSETKALLDIVKSTSHAYIV